MKTPSGLIFSMAIGLACLPALRAQQEAMILDPPLGQAFPLDAGADGVRLRYPVLVNDHTVVRPEAVLRFIYLDPNAGFRHENEGGVGLADDDDNSSHSHVGAQGTIIPDKEMGGNTHGEADGGWSRNEGSDTAGMFDVTRRDDPKRDKRELESEVWTQPDLFADALNHASELGTTLVYRMPGEKRSQTASFDLPEGMFLGEVGGHVRVLALSHDSRAYAAGLRAGDEILSIGGGLPVGTLDDFVRGFLATKHQARISGNPSYAMEIHEADSGQSVSIQIAAPPTIPSFF